MQPRRILIVSDEMEVGGSQRQIAQLLCNLSRDRWQAELLYFRKRSFLIDEIEASGVRCHCIPKRGRFDASFLWRLFRHLRRQRYELVHAFSFTAELWLHLIRPFVPRFAFVASLRDLGRSQTRWQWACKRRILRGANAVIANSQAGANAAALHTGIAATRLDVIANGVATVPPLPIAQREALRRELLLPKQRSIALFVGRLVEQKNLPLLLHAIAQLKAASTETCPYLLVAGFGPLDGELRQLANRLGLDSDVRFLGERSDVAELIAATDFLVVPSHDEGLSNVILEAMAAACAVVASDVGGNSELIEDGRSGLLFPAGDVTRCAQAIDLLSDNPKLREMLAGNACRKVTEGYSIERMVERTCALYERCLTPDRARPSAKLAMLPIRVEAASASAKPAQTLRPLRILLLLESHFPAIGGGAESQVRTLAMRMRRNGQRVTILTRHRRWDPPGCVQRYHGVVVCRLRYPELHYICSLVLWLRLASFLWRRRRRYDVWHAHIAHYLAAITCLLGRICRVRVVVKIAGSWEFEQGLLAPNKGALSAIGRRLLKQASVLQATSWRIAANLAAQGFARSRIVVLPNAVDTQRFRARVESSRSPRPLTGVFVGRFVVEKGLDQLLTAWARAYSQRRDIRLLMVGEGELETELRTQAQALGIAAQIEFVGYRSDVETLLANADFGLLPSLVEGLSNTLLEFMASGLPVLASRVSGSEDLIATGRNGWLFEVGDIDTLSAHLEHIAGLSPLQLRALGKHARSDVEKIAGIDSVVARLLAVYRGAPPAGLEETLALAALPVPVALGRGR